MKIFLFELNEVARGRYKISEWRANHKNEINEIVLLVHENQVEAEWKSE
jgi:hypothetical protein